MNLRFNTVTL